MKTENEAPDTGVTNDMVAGALGAQVAAAQARIVAKRAREEWPELIGHAMQEALLLVIGDLVDRENALLIRPSAVAFANVRVADELGALLVVVIEVGRHRREPGPSRFRAP